MIRVGSIVLRVDDLVRQTEFRAAALDCVPRDDPRHSDSSCAAEDNRFCVVDASED